MRNRPCRRRPHVAQRQQLLRLYRHLRQECSVCRCLLVRLILLSQVQPRPRGAEWCMGSEAGHRWRHNRYHSYGQHAHFRRYVHHFHWSGGVCIHRHRQLQLRGMLLRSWRSCASGQVYRWQQHNQPAVCILLRGLSAVCDGVRERVLLRQQPRRWLGAGHRWSLQHALCGG